MTKQKLQLNEEQILLIERISGIFISEGFSKVSMDELASSLKISKKTIYKNFASKEILIEKIMLFIISKIEKSVSEIVNSNQNAILKLTNLLEFFGNSFINVGEKILKDIELNFPSLWKKIDKIRSQIIRENFTKMIAQGKKEGLIIDKPDELILTIYISAIRSVVNPQFIIQNNLSFKEAMDNTFDILLNGISTTKGKNIFYKKFSGTQK